jgi:hypothetical protein
MPDWIPVLAFLTHVHLRIRVAIWYIVIPKIPIWLCLVGPWIGEFGCGYFMSIWNILPPFGKCNGKFVNLRPRFGMLYQEKIWQPCFGRFTFPLMLMKRVCFFLLASRVYDVCAINFAALKSTPPQAFECILRWGRARAGSGLNAEGLD